MVVAVARMLRLLGLGLLAGAVFSQEMRAQDTTRTRRDSVRRADSLRVAIPIPPVADSVLLDSLRKRDSLRAVRPPVPPRDSVKAPVARSESPRSVEAAGDYHWTRDSIYATGALTLADLLERVPGVSTFRVGWIASPAVAGYMGDLARVRVFFDGLELPALDPRAGRVPDLSWIHLWTLEDVRIERGASEIRVHLRSWRTERVTPVSRVDVGTGDQNTNLFRGFFGRRYAHGEVLQVGGQQFSTTPSRLGASSDQLSLLARVGIAQRGWSADAFVVRTTAHRGVHLRFPGLPNRNLDDNTDSIPELDATRTDAYVRAAVGDPEAGPWVQLLAGSLGHRYTGRITIPRDTTDTLGEASDTTRMHAQYVVTGGFTRGPFRVSLAHRMSVFGGTSYQMPSARVAFDSRWLAASLFADGRGLDSTSRIEAGARVTPLSFVSLAATAGVQRDEREGSGDGAYGRAEGAVRLRGLWLGGGILRRDASVAVAPSIFSFVDSLGEPAARRTAGAATGTFAFVRGTLYRALKADVIALQWDTDAAPYRPRYQTRSELYVATTLPKRFPTGNFGLRAGLTHEYQSAVRFPNGAEGERVTQGYRALSGLLEVRIIDAVLTYQYRNLLAQDYEQVPGYLMPRQTQFYGVRWSFWN